CVLHLGCQLVRRWLPLCECPRRAGRDVLMLWAGLSFAVFSVLRRSLTRSRGVSGIGHFCAEKEGEKKPDLIQQKCFDSVLLCGNMGRVLFVFQCATKRHLKTSKLVTKWNIHPAQATRVALNLDVLLEKQQCSDPAVPLQFEMSCFPLTSSKTSEAQSEEKQLQSNIKSVADGRKCLFIKWKEGLVREEMRSPRRAHKKWPQ
ncbi:LOW QUALITY PROTEIN: uncharacterized protein O3Q21_008307, partial [Podargus strigoides]